MYKIEHLTIIIPTFNRAKDLSLTIDSFKNKIKEINELIIVDQSTNNEVRNLVNRINNKNVKYVFSKTPSLTRARNIGVKKSSKKSKIIIFLDDDVSLNNNYFDKILDVFNSRENALGVGGYYLPKNVKKSKFESVLRKIFLIENIEPNSARVRSSYGAVYPSRLDKIIASEWIPGFNMAFKKEVFKTFNFDEKLSKYALAEDFDFSYRINKKYPSSLYITPYAKIEHRVSIAERTPTEKLAYMNQANHFYLNFKNFNSNIKEKIAFMWCVFGISLLRVLQFFKTRDKSDALKMIFFFQSLVKCLLNLQDIKKDPLFIK